MPLVLYSSYAMYLNNSVVIIIIATFMYKNDYHLYDMYNINACIDLYDNQKHSTYI